MLKDHETSASKSERKSLIPNPNLHKSLGILILYLFSTKRDYFLFAIGIISIILFRIAQLILIWEMGEVVEIMRENNSDKDIFYEEEKDIAIILFIVGGATLILGWIAVVCFLILGKNQAKKWRKKYFNTLITLPTKWYDKNNASELASTIERDFKNIELGSGIWVMIVLSAIFSYIATIIFSLVISLQLTLIMIAPLPLQISLWIYYMKISLNGAIDTQNEYKVANGIAEESFEGIKTIASCNAQDLKAKEYQYNLVNSKSTMTKIGLSQGALSALINMNLFAVSGILFYVGSIWYNNDNENWTTGSEIGIKEIVVVVMLFTSTMFYFGVIFPYTYNLIEAQITVEKIYNIISNKKKNIGINVAKEIEGEVRFENVYFSYPTQKNVEVLKSVTFTARKGEMLAIVGETGSGKSTIIQLIEGFYYAKKGKILIDGIDIKEYDLAFLREHIGLVSQEPILFSATIKENIQIGNLNASKEDIEKAAFEAEADFIADLPERFNTFVGVKGSQLSGGQKQRIAIARVLIKNPKILLLDEATSALDTNTERKIQKVLDEASKHRTTIVVAQRLSSIKNASKIIVLDQGTVIESGAHDFLMGLKGHYSRFHHMQIQNEKILDSVGTVEKETNKSEIKSYEESYATIKKSTMGSIWNMLMDYWPWLALASIAAAISGILFPILGYFFADNMNSLVGDSEAELENTTQTNMYYMLLEGLIILITLTLLCGALAKAASLLTYNIRYKGFNSILYYDQKFFDKENNSPSVLCYTFSHDCEKISKIGGPALAFKSLSVSGLIVGVIIGLIHDVIFTVVVAIFFAIMVIVNSTGDLFHYNENEKYETTNISYNSLTNIKTVQSLNRQIFFEKKYLAAYKAENGDIKKPIFIGFQYGFRYMMIFVVWGAGTWYGAYMVSNGDLSMENMNIVFISILFSTYAVLIVAAFSLSQDVDDGIKSAIRVNKIINYTPQINANSNEGETENINGSIIFNNVSFKYKSRDQIVLRNVSFEIPFQKHLGITGQSGSGKSTIAQLLLRFYDPISGEIEIDGKLINSYNLRYLRENIGYVSQEPILFKGSILYNLKIGKEDINEGEAIEAIKKAQASEIIEKYEINSDAGLRGHKLSGGEKQRIAIARALVRNPKILVLDESTSALDSVTETKLLNVLKNERITIISIAHRLRTIRDCDLIIVLEKGIAIEKGTHEELISNQNSCYYELFLASSNFD